MIVNCEWCGSGFEASRSDARFCTNTCYESRRSKLKIIAKKAARGNICEWCKGEIPDSRRSDATTCSIECNDRRKRERKRVKEREKNGSQCKECGEILPLSLHIQALYCSDQCRKAVKHRVNNAWRRANKEIAYGYYKRWAAKNYDIVSAHRHKRRAMEKFAFVEEVDSTLVYERDGWRCGICGGSISPSKRWPDSGSVTLDHIIPISKGGRHEYANCQAAHFGCNSRKGSRINIETLRMLRPE